MYTCVYVLHAYSKLYSRSEINVSLFMTVKKTFPLRVSFFVKKSFYIKKKKKNVKPPVVISFLAIEIHPFR